MASLYQRELKGGHGKACQDKNPAIKSYYTDTGHLHIDQVENCMTDAELINYLATGLPKGCRDSLAYWFKTSGRFRNFAFNNRGKIRKKVQKPPTDEAKDDIFFELEFPYLMLLDDRFEVDYERYIGDGPSPDFTVTFSQHTVFNAEVKRIREGHLGWRYDTCIEQICAEIRTISSSLHVYINHANTFLYKPDLVDRLESEKEAVIQFIKQVVQSEEGKLPVSTTGGREYEIPNFEGELFLSISKPPRKSNHSETPCFRGFRPIFYDRKQSRKCDDEISKESKKFGDVICEGIKQMREREINLLFVNSGSSTHEQEDLAPALESLAEQRDEFFIKKRFTDKQDFFRQFGNLGGILFRSTFVDRYSVDRNSLWCNPRAALRIPEPIKEYLKKMDCPATLNNSIWNALWSP